jgi:hypothetical protein
MYLNFYKKYGYEYCAFTSVYVKVKKGWVSEKDAGDSIWA